MDFTRRPWNPDPRWADPLLIFLALLLGLFFSLARQSAPPPKAPTQASMEGRELEIRFALSRGFPIKMAPPKSHVLKNPWDDAIQSILQAEETPDKSDQIIESPQLNDDLFQRVFQESYRTETKAQSLSADDHRHLQNALKNGLAYKLLALRHQEKLASPEATTQLKREVDSLIKRLQKRCIILASGLLLLAITGLAGLGIVLFRPQVTQPRLLLPSVPLPWRAVALVFLTWLLALALSGTVAQILTHTLFLPAPWHLLVAILFHIAIGLSLICKAQGLSWREFWQRLTPALTLKTLAWAALFLGIALWAVIATNVLASPLTRHMETPQQDIRDMVSAEHGVLGHLLVFLPIGVLAPFFEEVLFRGFLMPWLGNTFNPKWKKWAWPATIAVSGILFGSIHFQPAAAPSLSALGIVLGWAYVRSGNLWTAILIHACWNTGTWILMRSLLG